MRGNIRVPMFASERLCREVGVYQQFGCAVGELTLVSSPAGQEALKDRRYVRLSSKGDREPVDFTEGSKIVLSAFMNKTNDPVIEYSAKFRWSA